jgi:hypothetical protein
LQAQLLDLQPCNVEVELQLPHAPLELLNADPLLRFPLPDHPLRVIRPIVNAALKSEISSRRGTEVVGANEPVVHDDLGPSHLILFKWRGRKRSALLALHLVRRRRIMPNPRRTADNSASVDGSDTPAGPSTASDWAITRKATDPTPGKMAAPS